MKNELRSDRIPYRIKRQFVKLFKELKHKNMSKSELYEWKRRLKKKCKEVENMGYRVH